MERKQVEKMENIAEEIFDLMFKNVLSSVAMRSRREREMEREAVERSRNVDFGRGMEL